MLWDELFCDQPISSESHEANASLEAKLEFNRMLITFCARKRGARAVEAAIILLWRDSMLPVQTELLLHTVRTCAAMH